LNEARKAKRTPKTVDEKAVEAKLAVSRHLDAIVDHMNVLDEDGIEVQFNIAKTQPTVDDFGIVRPGEHAVTHFQLIHVKRW
jgi:hypothetical protein